VALAFLRICTSARVFERPLSVEQATSIVDDWLSLPGVRLIAPGHNHWPVLRVQRFDGTTRSFFPSSDNSGELITRGVELIGELQPLPGLHLSASLTWQDTDDRATGIDPSYSPRLLAKLKADYTRRPWTYAAFGHYVDAMETNWDFTSGSSIPRVVERVGERTDAYWDLGANLRYRHPGSGLFAELHASNLLNTQIRYPADAPVDFERGLIGPGRTVTATLGWEF
jgi:outer membrane receptor for ferrienterochelin and colicin